MYSYDKTDEATGMRVVEHHTNRKQKEQINRSDYITFALLLVAFLFSLFGLLFFFFYGISDHIEGNAYGAAWHWVWCIIWLIPLLILGLLTFSKARNIVKYRKNVKKDNATPVKGERVWATVKMIEYKGHIHKKDVYWLWCDIVCPSHQTIYRYKSEIVNEELFLRFNEGDKVAVYLNSEDPEDYYVDLCEKQ